MQLATQKRIRRRSLVVTCRPASGARRGISISRKRLLKAFSSWSFAVSVFVVSLLLATGVSAKGESHSENDGDDIPDNAFGKIHGRGWTCSYSYRRIGELCKKIDVPENGFLVDTGLGKGWECNRGYRAFRNECRIIVVPENGYLTESTSGRGWKCVRGYRAFRDECAPIPVPENAYLTAGLWGSGWQCERGFRASGDACVDVVIPADAHLTREGDDWNLLEEAQERGLIRIEADERSGGYVLRSLRR